MFGFGSSVLNRFPFHRRFIEGSTAFPAFRCSSMVQPRKTGRGRCVLVGDAADKKNSRLPLAGWRLAIA